MIDLRNLSILAGWPEGSTFLWLGLVFSLLLFLNFLRKSISPASSSSSDTDSGVVRASYPPIEPLQDFDWRTKEPVKIRPFKPKYHLTMSIRDATVSELIEMDKTYLDRIMLRRKIMAEHPETALAAEDCVRPAVDEFYIWLLGTYLPTRFPRMFGLQPSTGKSPACLKNLVTNEYYPLAPKARPLDTLRVMGGLIDDDLLFLLPSEDGDGYVLKGFVTCFPNGFDTAKKLNLKLRDIHMPVPQYKEKLEKSMDRYFDRLTVGKFVKRANWTVTTSGQLFSPSGTHLYEGEDIPQEDVDISIARVRVERQLLHRLPQTRALLFSFKTLLYTLPEIKEEGLGETLAEAIDGLKNGSAPGFHLYKRAAVWGEAVKAYLRN